MFVSPPNAVAHQVVRDDRISWIVSRCRDVGWVLRRSRFAIRQWARHHGEDILLIWLLLVALVFLWTLLTTPSPFWH